MARRRTARSGIPLEWKTDTVETVNATVTRGEFDLDLMPDEIAEIHLIRSTILTALATSVLDSVPVAMYLSMDPDADDTPATRANLEDLEVFYIHEALFIADYAEATETGGYALNMTSKDQQAFPEKHPILVGTNFAQVVLGDAAQATDFITTVYFKRRSANATELNNILLKRR